MRKVLHFLLNRVFITAIIVLVQVIFFLMEILIWSNYYVPIAAILRLISIAVIIYLIYRPNNPAVKLAWIIPIMLFPLFGGIMYLALGHVVISRKLRNRMQTADKLMRENMPDNESIQQKLQTLDQAAANQSRYISVHSGMQLWENTNTAYYSDGYSCWKQMLIDLDTAEKFIFMEYFIIEEGTMWNEVLKILEKKAAKGVDVRLIYDDFGSVLKLPGHYEQYIESKGIKCVAFNKLIPFMTVVLNNRDHRKIMVIDGKIGYTGGINMADEYINHKKVLGYWKDAGLRLEGEAVWNFTAMFLQMWNITHDIDADHSKYRYNFNNPSGRRGYVQPFGDTPFDNETLGENVYLNMLGYAKWSFYVFTPYLVTDNEMFTALKLAAKRGVDVRVVTPGIPDKKSVYWLTQSSYQNLIEAGVKIYQFTPGFIHSKCVLCDDRMAVVGTINFDYRSFYHHYECGVFLYCTDAVLQLKKDMEETFDKSELITLEWCKKKFMKLNVVGPILKLFSPLF